VFETSVHDISVKALPDVRGLVFFARCSCGWRGANHPSVPSVAEASQRATADAKEHRRETDGVPPTFS